MKSGNKKLKREKPIPKKKLEAVKELSELAKTKKTILIASTKNLPDSQFQEIRKKIRDKVIIKLPKKNIILRSLDAVDGEEIEKLKTKIKADCVLMFSDLGCFELASELIENKTPAKAKAGQIAPEDIKIEPGPTDLVPGPAISELGALGIPIEIKEGKIHIKSEKILVKEGKKITQEAAALMNKLDIKPFAVGFEPLAAFDTQEHKIYTEIKIDKQGALNKLKQAHAKALPLAVEVGYASDGTVEFLLQKAGSHEKVLKKIAETEKDIKEENSKDKKTNEEKNE